MQEQAAAELTKQQQVLLYDEDGTNVTPMSLLAVKQPVVKHGQQQALQLPQGTTTPTQSNDPTESFDRMSSAGMSRSGVSMSSSGASTPEQTLRAEAISMSLFDDFSSSRPASPRGDEAESKEGDKSKKSDKERGVGVAAAAVAAAAAAAAAARAAEEEVEPTEDELEQDVTVRLEETATIMLLEVRGTCVAMDSPLAPEVTERNTKYQALKKARATSDIYVERAMQTVPLVLKTKDAQATPGAVREAACVATAWDIFDAFKAGESTDELDGLGGAKAGEEKKEGAEEGAEGEEGAGEEAGGSGTGKDLLESEAMRSALRYVERMVAQNVFHQKHLSYRNYLTYEEAEALLAQHQAPAAPAAAAPPPSIDAVLGPAWSGQTTVTSGAGASMEALWRWQCALTAGRSVSCVSWNALQGDLLAVSYGSLEFGAANRREGLILFWSLKNPDYPERAYHTPCGVCSLAFSQAHPNLLAAGLYDGSVVIYDVRKGDPKPALESGHTAGKHADAVWDLKWVDRGSERGEALVSIAMDGRVTQWSMKKGLEHTDLMALKRVASAARGDGKGEAFISRRASGTCLDFSPRDPNLYVAGTEDGAMHRCSTSYNEQYLDSYAGHAGPVYRIRWSPFLHSAFLSCSADWTVKLWGEEQTKPVLIFQSCTDYVADICWSPHNGTVFASCTGDGRVEVWDLSQSTLDPVAFKVYEGRKLTSVRFGQTSPVLVVGDTEGNVEVFKIRGLEPEDPSDDAQRQRLELIMFPQAAQQAAQAAAAQAAQAQQQGPAAGAVTASQTLPSQTLAPAPSAAPAAPSVASSLAAPPS